MARFHSYIRVSATSWRIVISAHLRGIMLHGLLALCCLLHSAVPAVAIVYTKAFAIDNSATASYLVGTLSRDAASNAVSTQVCTQATLEFLKHAPGLDNALAQTMPTTSYCPAGNVCDPISGAGYLPVPLDAANAADPRQQAMELIKTDLSHPYHAGDLIFVQLTDGDRNIDATVAEKVVLDLSYENEKEKLLLTETGINTGIFAGYIQSARPAKVPLLVGDGFFTINKSATAVSNTPIIASYEDDCETVDGVTHIEIEANALVDPFGIVFDSRTGQAINGATVTLVNALTGQPALVYGDDGVSAYPATLLSGGSVTDASGTVYVFPPGFYRYPYVTPGAYRLEIIPPTGYSAPSAVSTIDLQMLPAAPFAIEPGSRGEVFLVNPGPALHIDIPLDPENAALWVTKSADDTTVAIGDFLKYTITVENTLSIAINSVQVTDRLPLGFRYRSGSTRLDGVEVVDPAISADGRTLTFPVGDLVAGSIAEIRFVTEIGAGARPGTATNLASATGLNGMTSNTAQRAVLVTEDLFRSATFIAGRVFPNGCSEEQDIPGVAGVRILLEDGTYAVTDEKGKYHFAAVKPGTHVVQLDLESIPAEYELVACEDDSRFAANPFSQFVDAQGGTLWRADFYLARKMVRVQGDVGLELNSTLSVETVISESNEAADVVIHPRFASGRAELSAEYRAQLDRVAESLKGLQITGMEVIGHTDSQHISARLRKVYPDNYALSRARAAVVAAYLGTALQLDPALITSAGKGPDEPVAGNDTPGGMARNRRVELKVAAIRTTSALVKSSGEISYEAPVLIGETPLTNVRLSIILPDGMTYLKGTSRLAEVSLPDPENGKNVLTYRLGDLAASWRGIVRFDTRVPFSGSEGEFKTQALLTFDSVLAEKQRTPLVDNVLLRRSQIAKVAIPPIILRPRFESGSADLSVADKLLLDEVAAKLQGQTIATLRVTGHTDPQRISKRLQAVYADNTALSKARAASVAQYLAAALKLSPAQLVTDGKGPDEPVASNRSHEGMAQNRRVELEIDAFTEKSSYDLVSIKDRSGIESVAFDETIEWSPALRLGNDAPESTVKETATMPKFDKEWLKKAVPGLAFVWPPVGFNPSLPVVKVVVKHDPQKKLTLKVNGEVVDPFFFDGTQKRDDLLLALTHWFGVNVKEGTNLFEAIEYNRDGSEGERQTLSIHYSGPPVKAELVKEQPGAVADGKTPAVIAVRLTDKDGHPARAGVVGEFKVNPPYIPYEKSRDLQKQPLTTSTSTWSKYRVGEDGVALIELQPTTQTGEAVVRFNLANGEQEVRSWLAPDYRDWILVGLAEGTVGYNTATGNMESLSALGEDTHYSDDGRIAFYAKGQVKGEWLLTMAYDSGKTPLHGRPGLYQTVDPNQYYLLYGDRGEQRHDAASAKKVYLKIERSQFYALFGDYATGMTVTELARYSRNLTGFKSEMMGKNFSYNLFAADTDQAFVKDEFQGDGTSGLYKLQRKNIVLNSEVITIETRDRFRSEVIIAEQELIRFLDYSIDYEDGTIFFKSPVYSRDENFNPIHIVVKYESFDSRDSAWSYGGRGALRLLDNRVEVGATYVHEGATGGSADLIGTDLTISVTKATKVRAEIASTDNNLPSASTLAGVPTQGRAWLAEVEHQSEKFDGKFYIREQEEGFGFGQQAGSEAGTRKIGGDMTYRHSDPWSAGLGGMRQENLATAAVRDMAEVRSDYNVERYSLFGGLRHAEDRLQTGANNLSEQVFAGLTYRFTSRLSVALQHDQSLYSNENIDFPTRTTLGADYKLSEKTTFFAAQEWTRSAGADTETTRIGMRTSPWDGGLFSSTVEQQVTENGTRLFASNGLKQTWQLTEHWTLDAGLDRSETLHKTSKNYDFDTDVPPASGSDDAFTAISLGAGYQEEKWAWTGRVENRNARTEDKFSLFSGVNGDVTEALAMAGSFQSFLAKNLTGKSRSFDLRLGIAYRPLVPRTIILDRLELIVEKDQAGNSTTESQRIINNFVTNIKPNKRTQFSLQYGAKYVLETIDSNDYSGFTDLFGLEGRYDITNRWDAGLRGSVLHTWSLHQWQYGSSVSVGYSPVKNLWANIGYNLTGFQDQDFSRADFTAQGPFIKLRLKFDQNSLRSLVKQF